MEKYIVEEVVYKFYIVEGKFYVIIFDYVECLGVDLIVMLSYKCLCIDKVMFGFVVSKVVENLFINVMVVKL